VVVDRAVAALERVDGVYWFTVYLFLQATHTCTCIYQILGVFQKYLRVPYPFHALKVCFAHETVTPVSFAGVVIAPVSWLHSPRHLDPSYEVRIKLARAVAYAWVEQALWVKGLADAWLVDGFVVDGH
jgi:hypothetical protein